MNVNVKQKESIRIGKGTSVIILVNIIIFIVLNVIPDIGDNLLLSSDVNTVIRKPWTLITVFFSHEVLIHIIANMGLFFYFGSRLEKITSAKAVAIVYFIAGLMGSLTFPMTGLIVEQTGQIAGASAAVLGVVTAFSVMRPDTVVLKSKAKWWVLALVIFSVLSAVIVPQSLDSGVAHLTGIFAGLIYGFWLKKEKTKTWV